MYWSFDSISVQILKKHHAEIAKQLNKFQKE
jgi:hypothetical protein